MAVKKFVIFGAGITGLILAYELAKKGQSVMLLEAKNHVGGLAKTIEHNGILVDSGPHLFHSAHKEIIEYWRSFVGENLVERGFYAGNYQGGKIYDYPINKETLTAQYTDDEVKLIEKQLASFEPKALASARNYNEYVTALAGPFLAAKFFSGYPEKLWGLKTEEMSARFAPRRIEIRDKRRPFHTGPGRFAGIIEGGCGVLAASISDELQNLGVKTELNAEVCSIELDHQGASLERLTLADSRKIDLADSIVISTLPITRNADLFNINTNLYFRSILTVIVIYKGNENFPSEYDWLYFDDFNLPFHRIGLQTRFSRKNIPEGCHILCCEVAYSGCISNQEKLDIEKECVKALKKMSFIEPDNVIDTFTQDLGPVYPGYYIGHEKELASVTAQLSAINNFYFLGSLAEYSYSDLQVLTAKAIDLAAELNTSNKNIVSELLKPEPKVTPSNNIDFGGTNITSDPSKPVFLIGEIGLSHNGDVATCKQLISKVAESGFNAAKIQTYSKGRVSKKSRTSRYFEESVDQEEAISDFLDRIIFSKSELTELKLFAEDHGVCFFSTPFDLRSLEQLHEIDCAGFKISSMDIVNGPLIKAAADTKKPIIMSTGMANLGEVETALNLVLASQNSKVMLMHCVSAYPCDMRFANLLRIKKLSDAFGVITGYSDHTVEVETPALATVIGARLVEKHVTLSKGMDGPDQHFSLTPNEMVEMVDLVRKAEASIASAPSEFSLAEMTARQNLRRSIYSEIDLKPGDIITPETVSIKSPGDGLPTKHYDIILGRRLIRPIDADSPLTWDHFLS